MIKLGNVRYRAAKALGSVFSEVPDKEQAWNDLVRLTNDEDGRVRSQAVNVLVLYFLKSQMNLSNRHGMI